MKWVYHSYVCVRVCMCVNMKIHKLAPHNTYIITTSRRLVVGNDKSYFMKKIIMLKQVYL